MMVLFCACSLNLFHYSDGDGEFVDAGPLEGSGRYRLYLGKLNFSKKDNKEYLIGDLPNENTLGFYLNIKLEQGITAVEVLSRLSVVKIKITIIIQNGEEKAFEYSGVLFKDGYRNGEYFREGLSPGESYRDGNKYVALTVPYRFNERYKICGIETPFFRNVKRIIKLEVIEPLLEDSIVADVVISGGGWQ